MATIPAAFVVEGSALVPDGKVVLKRRGAIVWFGDLAAPWDDADCDAIIVSPSDYALISDRFDGLG